MAGKLNDVMIRNLKPTGKQQKLSDGEGLFLIVTPKGSKLWRYRTFYNGKENTLSFGKYPAISLAQARQMKIEAQGLEIKGIDPALARKEEKARVKNESLNERMTFKVVAMEWLEKMQAEWAATNLKKKVRLLNGLFNVIGDKPISSIIPADILPFLKSIDMAGKTCTAHALAQTASQVFRYARICGYCMFNPADGLTGALKRIESKHYACLKTPEKVGELLRAIDEYPGSISVFFALKILPYVALRSTELRDAFWREIDFDKAVWTVPATRANRLKDGGGMKMRIAHEVPLARQAVNLFMQLKQCGQNGDLCFPGRQSKTACITDASLLNAIRSMGYTREDMTVHGFRGTFSTLLNEKKTEWGFDSDIIERQMAHSQKDAVRAAYNHASYMAQRRRLMQMWADYLDELKAIV